MNTKLFPMLVFGLSFACGSCGSNSDSSKGNSSGGSGTSGTGGGPAAEGGSRTGGAGSSGAAGNPSGATSGTGATGAAGGSGGSGASTAGGSGNVSASGGSGAQLTGGMGGRTMGGAGGLGGQAGSGGTSGKCRTTTLTQSAGDFELADFNADGWLDVLIPNAASNLLLGSAEGFLASNSVLIPDLPNGSHVRAAKLNGDDKLDFVSVGSLAKVLVFTGSGDGHFTLAHQQPITSGVRLVLGDFSDDGKIDLVYPTSSDGTLIFLAGNGDGTLAPPASPIRVSGQATDLAAADLNEDGHLDLAAGSSGGLACNILMGDGQGLFTRNSPPCDIYEAGGVWVGRIDNDAHDDVAFANLNLDQLVVYLGLGNGQFATETKVSAVGDAPTDVRLLDLNADGKLDAVTINDNTYNLSLALGNGDGTFQPPHAFKPPRTPYATGAGDVDQDGYTDLLVTYGEGLQIYYGPCSAP